MPLICPPFDRHQAGCDSLLTLLKLQMTRFVWRMGQTEGLTFGNRSWAGSKAKSLSVTKPRLQCLPWTFCCEVEWKISTPVDGIHLMDKVRLCPGDGSSPSDCPPFRISKRPSSRTDFYWINLDSKTLFKPMRNSDTILGMSTLLWSCLVNLNAQIIYRTKLAEWQLQRKCTINIVWWTTLAKK